MIEKNVNLGIKNIWKNSYFTFDIVNAGTADLIIYDASVSSNNIFLNYIKLPLTLPINASQNINGYIKIINTFDSTGVDYVDLFTYYIDNNNVRHDEVYRYYLNYFGFVDLLYSNVQLVNNINNINNMLVLYLELSDLTTPFPRIILSTIDNKIMNVIPKIYKMSLNKVMYLFQDNNLINKVVDNEIKFLIMSEVKNINIKSLAQRTV